MEIKSRPRLLPLIFACCLLLSGLGCTQKDQLMIFAAASLKEPLSELANDFEKRENVKLQFTFAGSITLSNQLKRELPADIFIAAGENSIKTIQSTRMVNLLTNQLVLIVPKNTQRNGSFSEVLANSKLIAIADPKLAPSGKYSKEVLTNMELWESVEAKLVFGGNVKTALAWVQFRNADSGIVYVTDTFKNQNVEVVSPIPDSFHSPIVYPAAVLDTSERKQLANAFIDFLQSTHAQEVFEKYGFGLLMEPITSSVYYPE